jgi:hypothetical protein
MVAAAVKLALRNQRVVDQVQLRAGVYRRLAMECLWRIVARDLSLRALLREDISVITIVRSYSQHGR